MTTPLTTEMPQRLEPVAHDPFIDDLTRPGAFAWPVEAARTADPVQEQAGDPVFLDAAGIAEHASAVNVRRHESARRGHAPRLHPLPALPRGDRLGRPRRQRQRRRAPAARARPARRRPAAARLARDPAPPPRHGPRARLETRHGSSSRRSSSSQRRCRNCASSRRVCIPPSSTVASRRADVGRAQGSAAGRGHG